MFTIKELEFIKSSSKASIIWLVAEQARLERLGKYSLVSMIEKDITNHQAILYKVTDALNND
jgi:hypothetical protein